MSKKRFFAVLLGVVLTCAVIFEVVSNLPLEFQGQPLQLNNICITVENDRISDITPYAGCLAMESDIISAPGITKEDLAPERRAEYFYVAKLLLIAAAAIMLVLALIFGFYSKFKAVPLTRLRYEKLIFFGFILPIAAGGFIVYLNVLQATDYGIWYNWPKFVVYATLMTCAVLYITLAMTRKYVNRYCHSHQIAVPPFQRWPGLLNTGTVLILLAAVLTPADWREVHYAALCWVILTAIIYLLREIKYIRQLAKYRSYYHYAAGTAYITLCISALGITLLAVPLWNLAEKNNMSEDRFVMDAFKAAAAVQEITE